MTPEALELRAKNNLAQLPPKERERVEWLLNAGADDTARQIKAMTGTPADVRVLEVAYDMEQATFQRVGRLKPITAALKRFPKPAALAVVEVTTDSPATTGPEDPRWLAVKDYADRLRETGRTYLEMQAWLGWQLAQLKKEHGVQRGKNQHGGSAGLPTLTTWEDLVKHYAGLSRRTADVFIQLFEATKAKLKRAKAPEQKAALVLFNQGNPLALPDDQRGYVRDVISSLCTGETQGSLMAELGIVPKPLMPKKTMAGEEEEKLTDVELAHHHWEGTAKAIVTARSPEGVKLLHVLPTVTDEPGKLSLVFLREETAALLAAVEEAMATAPKPPKRKS